MHIHIVVEEQTAPTLDHRLFVVPMIPRILVGIVPQRILMEKISLQMLRPARSTIRILHALVQGPTDPGELLFLASIASEHITRVVPASGASPLRVRALSGVVDVVYSPPEAAVSVLRAAKLEVWLPSPASISV
jgi:hypothetical protein